MGQGLPHLELTSAMIVSNHTMIYSHAVKDEVLRYLFSKIGEVYTAIPTKPLSIQQYEQVLAEIEAICLQVLVGDDFVYLTSQQNRELALREKSQKAHRL